MSWSDVHRYYDALHRAEAELNRSGDGIVTWHDEYEAIFGTPQQLLRALRSHWDNLVRAQVECDSPQNWRRLIELNRLAAAHPGLAAAAARATSGERITRSDVELVGSA